MVTAYYADCDQFDNHRTGYYSTPEAAIAAFWEEATFSPAEQARVQVYTRDEEVDPAEIVH